MTDHDPTPADPRPPETFSAPSGPVLVSEDGIILVYQGRQGSLVHKMLTVESCIKWYDIHAVSPDGTVEPLPREISEAYRDRGRLPWSDHIPTPEFCRWIVETHPEYEWDEPSLDMIYGRWQRYRVGNPK